MFFSSNMSLMPSVRKTRDGRISTLLPAMRRAQVPFGISKVSSREAKRTGVNAAQATAANAANAAAATIATTVLERLRNGCAIFTRLIQQHGNIVDVVIGFVPERHQGSQLAVTTDEIDE